MSAPSNAPRTRGAVTALDRARLGAGAVAAADREHAAVVVAHLLHRECAEWSWTSHRPESHLAEARGIVGALCREGWSPA